MEGVSGPALGPVRLDHPYILAPMAGIGDPPYRRLCRRAGAAMVCAEMVSSNALHHGDERSRRMLRTYPDEHPVSVQIFGDDPERLAEAARMAEAEGADVVDLNCGCPVPKVTKSGAGIALMKDEARFARCVEAMARAVRVPVTVKMRLGFNRGENLAVAFARVAAGSGARAVAVHARVRGDVHKGEPDLTALAEVVGAAGVPVIGNGGIKSQADARRMLEATGCAAVMVGQAAVGDPLFFEAVRREDGGGVSPARRFALLREHARLIVEYYGEELGLRRLRKYYPGYLRGVPGAAALRDRANRTVRLEDLMEVVSAAELVSV